MSEPSASAVERADQIVHDWMNEHRGWIAAWRWSTYKDLIFRIARALDAAPSPAYEPQGNNPDDYADDPPVSGRERVAEWLYHAMLDRHDEDRYLAMADAAIKLVDAAVVRERQRCLAICVVHAGDQYARIADLIRPKPRLGGA